MALLSEQSLVVVDLESGTVVARLEPPLEPHGMRCLAWHPNNRYLAVYGYRQDLIYIWDTATQKIHRRFSQPGAAVSIAFDRSGQNLISSSMWLGEVNGLTWNRKPCDYPHELFARTWHPIRKRA